MERITKEGRKENCFGNWWCLAVLYLTEVTTKTLRSKDNLGSKKNGKTGGGKTVMSSKGDSAQKSTSFEFYVYCFTCWFSWQPSGVRRSAIITISIWPMKTLMSLNLCGFEKKKKTQLTSYFEIILIYRKLTKTGQKVFVYFSSLTSPKTSCPFWSQKPSGVRCLTTWMRVLWLFLKVKAYC